MHGLNIPVIWDTTSFNDVSEELAACTCRVCAVQGERTAKTLKKAVSCFEIPATICLQIRCHNQDDRIPINTAVITCSIAVRPRRSLLAHCSFPAAHGQPNIHIFLLGPYHYVRCIAKFLFQRLTCHPNGVHNLQRPLSFETPPTFTSQ